MRPDREPALDVAVLIAAAGSGSRVGAERNKLVLPLVGEPVLRHTVRVFQRIAEVSRIGIIVRPEDIDEWDRSFRDPAAREKLLPWITGGAERQDSVYNGLATLAPDPPAWVLVHDGARPCCSPELVGRVLDALREGPAAIPVVPVTDTIRRIEAGQGAVMDREGLYGTQTPQGFHWSLLWEAHQAARNIGLRATDDAQLVEVALAEGRGGNPVYVAGDPANIKITTSTDFAFGNWWLARRD